ncbi:DUF7738 domain-containing protein [Ferruginibacter sp.]
MKNILITIVLALAFCSSHAQVAPASIKVVIKDGEFSIGKSKVTDGWKLDDVMAAIGDDRRRRAGYNTTHSYDNAGMVLFERNDDQKLPTGVVSEIQFHFAKTDSNNIVPKGYFKGKITIEKLVVTPDLTSAKLKEALKDYKVTDSYMEHNIRLAYKGLYIYFLFNPEETALLKVSVGKDTRTY